MVAYPFCPSWAAVGEQVTAGYAAFFFSLDGTRLSVMARQPLAEIVLADDATPQARLAAAELRDHIQKISGAALAITNSPGGVLKPVYVGASAFTRNLGLSLDGLGKEGYTIVASDEHLVLFGRDEIFPSYPLGHTDHSTCDRLLRAWHEYTGEQSGFPFLSLYDPRNFNEEYGFSLFVSAHHNQS